MQQNICIVTSAIGSHIGAVKIEDRYVQTIKSIETIRNKIPNCIIILNDISIVPVDEYKSNISKLVDVFIDSSDNEIISELSRMGLKSHGDLLLVKSSLEYIIENINLDNINRIFKLSGRHNITDEFNFQEYENTENMYVFKKPVNSWISPELKLYEARLWSMHVNNINDYLMKFKDMFNSCDGRFDIEHTYYKYLSEKTIEFENIWVEGIVAPDAHYQKD